MEPEADPVLNYGSKRAKSLREMNEAQFTATPSRLTAEPTEREQCAAFLAEVTANGYVSNYRGFAFRQADVASTLKTQ